MPSPKSYRLHILLVATVLVTFSLAIFLVFQLKPKAEIVTTQLSSPKVRVTSLRPENISLNLSNHSLLQVLDEQHIISQTQGSIIEVNPAILKNRSFKQGELLFAIDESQAKHELQLALSKQKQAQLHLAELHAHRQAQKQHHSQQASTIAKLQLDLAEQQLKTANSAVELAQQRLQSCRFHAPFDGKALKHQLKVGGLVTPGSPLVSIYPSKRYQTRIPINLQQYQLLQLGNKLNNKVQATDESSGIQINGYISHTEGQLSANRLLYVIAIFDQISEEQFEQLIPLTMMSVSIESPKIENLFRIPDTALRSGNTVWLLNDSDILEIRAVNILHRDQHFIYINQGLKAGEQLITSPLANAINGMSLLRIKKR